MTIRVAGVDAGGTRTRALVMDAAGRIVGEGEAGPGLLDPRDPQASVAAIVEALARAAKSAGEAGGAGRSAGGGGLSTGGGAAEAGQGSPPLDALWVGAAGAGRPDPRALLLAALRAEGLARVVEVGTDAEAAFHDAFGSNGPGVLLVSGTGSVVLARGGASAEEGGSTAGAPGAGGAPPPLVRCGGWGQLLGDEGSAWRVGLEGLRRVCRRADGREDGPEDGREEGGELSALLLGACGVASPSGLVTWALEAGKEGVAALAPVVVRAADAGDAGAGAIVQEAVTDLLAQVRAAARRAGCVLPVRVALTGGLAEADGRFRRELLQALKGAGFIPVGERVNGARGGARLALGLVPGPSTP